jgi:hypothetical protein
VKDSDLVQAIRLGISKCFGAMSIANTLGGSPSIPWDLVRKHGLAELVADALDRGIDVKSIKAAVDETPFMETTSYLRVRDEIGGRPDFPQ